MVAGGAWRQIGANLSDLVSLRCAISISRGAGRKMKPALREGGIAVKLLSNTIMPQYGLVYGLSCPCACPGRWLLYWLSCPCKSKAKQRKQGGWAVAPAVAQNRRRRFKGSECIKGFPRNYAHIMQQHAVLHMPLCCPPTRGGDHFASVTSGKILARTAGHFPY